MGYGAALKTGISHVQTPYVVTIDGDGQHKLEDIDTLLQIAQSADADLVIGSRVNQGQESKLRKTGKNVIRSFARMLMPLPVKDLNSGFKLYRSELVLTYLSLAPDSMAFSDTITLCFVYKGHKVLEHPIQTNPRTRGKSTINLATAFDTILQILNISVLFNPLKVFLPASLFFIVIGFLWGLPFVIMGRGVSVGAMLSILAGLIFFAIGLIAHQLSALRMQLLEKNNLNARQTR
jgi:glycosyltransferase involved in cell wall biosynthesis